MKRNSLLCWTAAAVLVFLTVAGPALALEKVGTTSMQVLKIPMGVRGIGMGNAMSGYVDDAEAVWYNPGALTEVQGNQFHVAQINMPADIHLNSFALAHRHGDYQTFALQAISLVTSDMPIRTYEHPEGTGENFNASDFAVGASYARKLTDRFSLGANIRYLHSGLEETNYDGVAVDLGTLYKTGLRSLRLGMAIQNLGPEVKYSGTYKDYRGVVQNNGVLLDHDFEGANLPTMFRLGVGFNVLEMFNIAHGEGHELGMAIEMNHPNDNKERLNLGAEYGWMHRLFLRAGGKFGYDEESFSAGFGVKIPLAHKMAFNFDAAYSHWGRITEATDEFMSQPFRGSVGLAW